MVQASKKITERLLNWYGHVMRRDEEHTKNEEKVLMTVITGKTKRGRKQDGKLRA